MKLARRLIEGDDGLPAEEVGIARVIARALAARVAEGFWVRFAPDSPVEGPGFEPSVPRKRDSAFTTLLVRSFRSHLPRDSGSLDRGPSGRMPVPSRGESVSRPKPPS